MQIFIKIDSCQVFDWYQTRIGCVYVMWSAHTHTQYVCSNIFKKNVMTTVPAHLFKRNHKFMPQTMTERIFICLLFSFSILSYKFLPEHLKCFGIRCTDRSKNVIIRNYFTSFFFRYLRIVIKEHLSVMIWDVSWW